MKQHTLLQIIGQKIVAYIQAKWSGEINIKITFYQGGVRHAEISTKESMNDSMLEGNQDP